AGRGLLVVGSHTQLTTRQLRAATARHELAVVTLDVEALIAPNRRGRVAAITKAAADLVSALARTDAALVTSRASAHRETGEQSLRTAAVAADALVDIVSDVVRRVDLDWL